MAVTFPCWHRRKTTSKVCRRGVFSFFRMYTYENIWKWCRFPSLSTDEKWKTAQRSAGAMYVFHRWHRGKRQIYKKMASTWIYINSVFPSACRWKMKKPIQCLWKNIQKWHCGKCCFAGPAELKEACGVTFWKMQCCKKRSKNMCFIV